MCYNNIVMIWRLAYIDYNKNMVNLEYIDDFIKNLDSKIKNVEEKELDGKSPKEQQKLK